MLKSREIVYHHDIRDTLPPHIKSDNNTVWKNDKKCPKLKRNPKNAKIRGSFLPSLFPH